MALGTNRDYKTRDRNAAQDLRWHANRMAELEASGLSHTEASRVAFDELRAIPRRKRV